jgi:hypothetical protein
MSAEQYDWMRAAGRRASTNLTEFDVGLRFKYHKHQDRVPTRNSPIETDETSMAKAVCEIARPDADCVCGCGVP